jgi:hypothetical protein
LTRRWLTSYAWEEDDELHIDVAAALEHLGQEVTPENEARLAQLLEEGAIDLLPPGTPIEVVEP